ncbi:hypothetical protein [Nocardia sp. CA-135398]|uniref:hypothetical protein n=1 Tax=Nocardia sp. CA-135398 TaxID=3239977 RepID=UPI003D97284E
MFSTIATFGAPADVTLSELAIELFYPLDEFTAAALRGLAPNQMSWNPLPTPPVASTA